MLHRNVSLLCRITALCGFAILMLPATAQEYPARPVRFVVPQAPGGGTDIFARAIGQRLSARWGQPVVVDNRAGAAGTLGTDMVAKSAPDGYTLLFTYAGSQAINQSLYPKLPFDSVKDFQTVATVAVTPFFLIVHRNHPAKDLREFVALARKKPNGISFGSSGNGSVPHLIGEVCGDADFFARTGSGGFCDDARGVPEDSRIRCREVGEGRQGVGRACRLTARTVSILITSLACKPCPARFA